MVSQNDNPQPQPGDNPLTTIAGALNESQPESDAGQSPAPGAEDASQEPSGKPGGRTYTEAEWNQRQSALDKQVAQANGRAARIAMELEVEVASSAENAVRSSDLRAVEDGDISQDQANQRAQQRQEEARTTQERRATAQAYQQLLNHGEDLGRIAAAEDYAKEFGVDSKELLADGALTSPDAMRLKARELALEKREDAIKIETSGEDYDGGGGGTGGGAGGFDNKDPMSMIRHGLANPPRRGRKST
jgi:hypothetical protein